MQGLFGLVFCLWPPIYYKSVTARIFYIFFLVTYSIVLLTIEILVIGKISQRKNFIDFPQLLQANIWIVCFSNAMITLKLLSKSSDIGRFFKAFNLIGNTQLYDWQIKFLFYGSTAATIILKTTCILLRKAPRYDFGTIGQASFHILLLRNQIVLLMLCILSWKIKTGFKHFNQELLQSKDPYSASKLRTLHSQLLDCVDSMNDIFGSLMFCSAFGSSVHALFDAMIFKFIEWQFETYIITLLDVILLSVSIY